MAESINIQCSLIDGPVTLTIAQLRVPASGIGDSRAFIQFEVGCSEPWPCPCIRSELCPRRLEDQRRNGE